MRNKSLSDVKYTVVTNF